MIDFSKMNDPKEREKRKNARIELELKLAAREKANKFMVAKLFEMFENGEIQDEYDCGFISSMNYRINAGLPLTDRQEAYLEKCFHEKY